MNIIIAADSNTFQQLQGYYSTLSLWILIVSMVISGVAGLLGLNLSGEKLRLMIP